MAKVSKQVRKQQPAAKVAAKPQVVRTPNPCLCGCGENTKGRKSRFIPGHDAKLHSMVIAVQEGKRKPSNLPSIASDYIRERWGAVKVKKAS